jgi:hypothetical protein
MIASKLMLSLISIIVRMGAFQLGGRQLPDEEDKWGLPAPPPGPNPTSLSSSPPDGYVAPFLGMHPFELTLLEGKDYNSVIIRLEASSL